MAHGVKGRDTNSHPRVISAKCLLSYLPEWVGCEPIHFRTKETDHGQKYMAYPFGNITKLFPKQKGTLPRSRLFDDCLDEKVDK